MEWYYRGGVEPWTLGACTKHGAELAELGFEPGAKLSSARPELGPCEVCAFCQETTSIDDVRACKCHVLGEACPVHGPAPAGVAGEWARARCGKCGAELELPAERIAWQEHEHAGVIAIDLTGWVKRNAAGPELRCPFHGQNAYYLERVTNE